MGRSNPAEIITEGGGDLGVHDRVAAIRGRLSPGWQVTESSSGTIRAEPPEHPLLGPYAVTITADMSWTVEEAVGFIERVSRGHMAAADAAPDVGKAEQEVVGDFLALVPVKELSLSQACAVADLLARAGAIQAATRDWLKQTISDLPERFLPLPAE